MLQGAPGMVAQRTANIAPVRQGAAATLLVGLGSPCGDDAVGGCVAAGVAEALRHARAGETAGMSVGTSAGTSAAALAGAAVRLARAPLELLDWCGGQARLVIVDACVHEPGQMRHAAPSPGTCVCWRWPALPAVRRPPATSHHFGLAEALALADALRILPAETVVVGIWVDPCAVTSATRHGPLYPQAGAAGAAVPTLSAPGRPTPAVAEWQAELIRQLSPGLRAALPKIIEQLLDCLAAPMPASHATDANP